eukprot:TRINITY_DN8021_c0_g1_i1.p1 TRINITY_DN8021_c0_g1~~TRINITY_DN8021_c0_g1_i1.p1  ORF type:complete len:658 (+),score=90.07 TRINITY_DN8021_c0_g1_i1:146-2119(+)
MVNSKGAAGGKEITVGCRVAVLSGRHFPAFGSGDEGVVIKVAPESQNCEVQFDNRPVPVPVALRHLSIVSPARPGSNPEGVSLDAGRSSARGRETASFSLHAGKNAPERDSESFTLDVDTSNNRGRTADSFSLDGGKSSAQGGKQERARSVSLRRKDTTCSNCGNIFMADSVFCRSCGQRRSEDVNCPSCGNVFMADSNFCRACGHQRATAQADAEEASAEPWSGLTSLLHAEGPSMEPCEYMDSTAGFAAGLAAVSGAAGAAGASNGYSGPGSNLLPGAMVGLDLNGDGRPNVLVAGNGMPDRLERHLQAAGGAAGTKSQPSPCEPVAAFTPRGSVAPVGSASESAHCNAEVAALRHALEQCVHAIGLCARAIDSMCVQAADPEWQVRDALVGWKSAAAALHDAANLGQKALQTTSSDYRPPVVSSLAEAAPTHIVQQQPPRRSTVSSAGAALATPGTAVQVEVLSGGSAATRAGDRQGATNADAAQVAAGSGLGLSESRRFLHASPAPLRQISQSPVPSTAAASCGPSCMHTSTPPSTVSGPPQTVHPQLGGAPHLGAGQHLHASSPALGQLACAQAPWTAMTGTQPCQGNQLNPPANLLGGFHGLSLSGFPGTSPHVMLGAVSPPMGAALPHAGHMTPPPGGLMVGPAGSQSNA